MKLAFSRARVGLLIFVGVLAFVVGIFTVGEKNQLFSSTYSIHVNFSAAEGVKTGSMVVLSGYNIGTVTDIQLSKNADSVRLTLRIDESVKKFIKPDSKAEIKQEGLVGNKIINILIGSPMMKSVDDGGYIQGEPPFALTSLADNVTAITDTTKRISGELLRLLGDLNRGEGTIGRLLKDDDLYVALAAIITRTDTSLAVTMDQIEDLTRILKNVSKSVDHLVVNADSAVQEVNAITKETRLLVENMNAGKGTVGALISDRALYDSLVTLIDALTDVTYDAGNVTDQTAQSIHAMRQHWLLGRFMGADEAEKEGPPTSSYRRKMQEVQRLLNDLEERQKRIEEKERKLGIGGASGETK